MARHVRTENRLPRCHHLCSGLAVLVRDAEEPLRVRFPRYNLGPELPGAGPAASFPPATTQGALDTPASLIHFGQRDLESHRLLPQVDDNVLKFCSDELGASQHPHSGPSIRQGRVMDFRMFQAGPPGTLDVLQLELHCPFHRP